MFLKGEKGPSTLNCKKISNKLWNIPWNINDDDKLIYVNVYRIDLKVLKNEKNVGGGEGEKRDKI